MRAASVLDLKHYGLVKLRPTVCPKWQIDVQLPFSQTGVAEPVDVESLFVHCIGMYTAFFNFAA